MIATPSWFRPWMIWAAAVIALVGLLSVQTVRLADAEAATDRAIAAHETTKREHAEALARANADALTREHKLQADLEHAQAAAAKEKEIAKAREDALVESVRAGARRLSIAAQCPGNSSPGAAAASGGGSNIQRAELAPQAGVDLIGIARDGDEAIRERNACVAAYEAVRARINGAGTVP